MTIDKLASEMKRHIGTNPEKQDDLEREVNYFKENATRMKYAEFKKRGLFAGSGVIEVECKNVIGKRLKQSGMHWSVRGANAIIALRCAILSGKFKLPEPISRLA